MPLLPFYQVRGYVEEETRTLDFSIGKNTTEGKTHMMCIEGSEGLFVHNACFNLVCVIVCRGVTEGRMKLRCYLMRSSFSTLTKFCLKKNCSQVARTRNLAAPSLQCWSTACTTENQSQKFCCSLLQVRTQSSKLVISLFHFHQHI